MANKKYFNDPFFNDLINVLERRNVGGLDRFVKWWSGAGIIDIESYKRYKNNNKEVRMALLCKIILSFKVNVISKETREWAKEWLDDHGVSPELN